MKTLQKDYLPSKDLIATFSEPSYQELRVFNT